MVVKVAAAVPINLRFSLPDLLADDVDLFRGLEADEAEAKKSMLSSSENSSSAKPKVVQKKKKVSDTIYKNWFSVTIIIIGVVVLAWLGFWLDWGTICRVTMDWIWIEKSALIISMAMMKNIMATNFNCF